MKESIRSIADNLRFFCTFVRSPFRVGSIIPSSKFLAKAMLQNVRWEQIESIVELGAGTGVFTRYIYKKKPEGSFAIIFEQDQILRNQLKERFPGLIFRSNAIELLPALEELGLSHVDVIISGLPFAMFPQTMREEILRGVSQALKPGGLFVAFQYSLQLRKQLNLYFSSVEYSFVPLNIPPAFVYTCYK
jgi:phospholipid N-methyltransferase